MKYFSFLLVLVCFGCAGANLDKMSIEDKIAEGDKYYEMGKFGKAIPYYDAVVFQKIGSNTEEVSFKLADCYMQRKEYDLASLEYKQIIADYPRFSKLNEVYFNLAVCYKEIALAPQYDQKERHEQIKILKQFLTSFPYDEKVDEAKKLLEEANFQLSLKKYYSGYIYYKIHDYSSAELYFKEVLDELSGEEVDAVKMSLYYLCRIYIVRKNEVDAKSYSEDLSYYFPNSSEALYIERKLKSL